MRHLIIIFSISFFLYSLSGCQDEQTVELSIEDFEKILNASISSATIPLERIKELDPYESYFLALKAAEYGYIDASLELGRHCWKNSGGFIGAKAAGLCISLQMENRNYSEAEFLASLAAAEYPDDYSFKRDAVEAEYWQHEDQSVLSSVSALRSFQESVDDYELYLFEAIAAYRLDVPGWQGVWISMFQNVPVSEYIRRGWDYLLLAIDNPYAEFPEYFELIEGKYLASCGKEEEALGYLTSESVQPELVNTILQSDLENIFLKTSNKVEGGRFFEVIAAETNNQHLFTAARLYRRGGKYKDAQRCMNIVISQREDEDVTDRELWYSLDLKIRRNVYDAVEHLDFYIERWDDPDFFIDSLDNLCTNLVRRRQWGLINQIAEKLENKGPFEIYSRCHYISIRAAELGFIDETRFNKPLTDLYYRILSGDRLEEYRADKKPEQPLTLDNDAESFIDGLIRYGVEDILPEVKNYRDDLSEDFLLHCASETARAGRPLDSIRIMYQYQGEYSASGLRGLYPDLYRDEIEQAAKENEMPVQLLFGIVWKESGFEHEIVSRSGAVGLSQLMPSTADDVAGRNGREVGDLTNPIENLALGSWYFNWLTGYVGNTAAAVLSYNGGPGRIKGWLRSFPDLPLDLFYETVPVAETHQYGKKVLTASVLYGLFYYNIEAEQTLKLFF